MAEHVCPWWMGYFLASPLRRWFLDPEKVLRPYVKEGMTVLEPGPGMGFFTMPMARMVGESGRVVAVDVQEKMLNGLRRRAEHAGLLPRIELRQARKDSLCIEDLNARVDLIVAIAVVHEMPSEEAFFRQAAEALKPGGLLLLIEPRGHVKATKFTHELHSADEAGLRKRERILGGQNEVALLAK
jgi:ubiquinone/menaquinone biosynthesis C-methylase UbiE